MFLESGKAYTASVVCLGSHSSTGGGVRSERSMAISCSSLASTAKAARSSSAAACPGFRVTVYSARPVQVSARVARHVYGTVRYGNRNLCRYGPARYGTVTGNGMGMVRYSNTVRVRYVNRKRYVYGTVTGNRMGTAR